MHATIELFRKLSAHLDAAVLKAGALAEADDIHPAIRAVGIYAADEANLPKALSALKAERPEAETRFLEKEEAVRKAAHPLTMLGDKIRRLNDALARNAKLAEQEMEPLLPAKPAKTYGIGLDIPASRRECVARLAAEIETAKAEAKDAGRKLKNAKDARRRAKNRLAEIDAAIAETEAKIADHAKRLPETVKLLRKTITHLENRLTVRERKRAKRETGPIEVVSAPAEDMTPTGPTDEDIRAKAEAEGLAILTADDLEAARQLFA